MPNRGVTPQEDLQNFLFRPSNNFHEIHLVVISGKGYSS